MSILYRPSGFSSGSQRSILQLFTDEATGSEQGDLRGLKFTPGESQVQKPLFPLHQWSQELKLCSTKDASALSPGLYSRQVYPTPSTHSQSPIFLCSHVGVSPPPAPYGPERKDTQAPPDPKLSCTFAEITLSRQDTWAFLFPFAVA